MNLDVDSYEELYNEIYEELEDEYFQPAVGCTHEFCSKWKHINENINCQECYRLREEEFNAAVDKRVKEVLNEGKDD